MAAPYLSERGTACHLRKGDPRELIAATGVSSAFLALSFSANFSFAFVDATAMLLILVWAMRAAGRAGNHAALRWMTAAAGVFPGFLVILFIPSWTLLHWSDIMTVAGVKTLRETLNSLAHASTYRPNPYLLNPLLLPIFEKLRRFVLPALGALVFAQFGWILRERVWRRSEHKDADQTADAAWLCSFAGLVGAIAALTVLEHRLAYGLFHLLMPVAAPASSSFRCSRC